MATLASKESTKPVTKILNEYDTNNTADNATDDAYACLSSDTLKHADVINLARRSSGDIESLATLLEIYIEHIKAML